MTQSATDADARCAADCKCSANATRQTIYRYLAASAGTANHPTDHTIRCFIGMIQTGEATIEDFDSVGGQYVVDRIVEMATANGWSLSSE